MELIHGFRGRSPISKQMTPVEMVQKLRSLLVAAQQDRHRRCHVGQEGNRQKDLSVQIRCTVEQEAREVVEHRFARVVVKSAGVIGCVAKAFEHQSNTGCPALRLLMQRPNEPIFANISRCGDFACFIQSESQHLPMQAEYGAVRGKLCERRRRLGATHADD